MTREKRERELRKLLGKPGGAPRIIEMYQEKVAPELSGRPTILTKDMIPLIVNAEFPATVEVVAPGEAAPQPVGKVIFPRLRIDGSHAAECNPPGLLSESELEELAGSVVANASRGSVGNFEWRLADGRG